MISDNNKIRDYIKFIYPLCLYSFLQQIYGLVDVINGSFIGAHEMSYIVYIDQIMLLILAFANSIVVGISVLTSKRMEQEKDEEIKFIFGNSITLLLSVSTFILLFIIFFKQVFLTLILAPAEFYDLSNGYLIFRGINNIFLFLNLALLAVEKTKGNTRKVFMINVVGILVKLTISILISNTLTLSLNIVGLITLLPTVVVFALTMHQYHKKTNKYKIRLNHFKLKLEVLKELVLFSLPLFLSLCLFSIGKTVVNIQALRYGVEAVGYLGVSNRLVGLMVGMSTGVQEGVAILLARYRENNIEKTRFVIKSSVILNIAITAVFVIVYIFNFNKLTLFFAEGNSQVAAQIGLIFGLELLGGILLPLTNFINGILYGYERTKLVFLISFFRIIILRNLVLFAFSFTNLGISALGFSMLISHVGTFIVSLIIVKYEFRVLK